jgi:aryl-alcohol dehydrogenase-like predicted oxidoreductase
MGVFGQYNRKMSEKNVLQMRSIGTTGIQVTPVGLGVMQFSGGAGPFGVAFPVMTQEEKTLLVKTALDGGINWFDTAELYGIGQSERNLSQALQDLQIQPGSVVVATKWWPLFRTARNILHTIKDRIKYLAPYPIDLYYVHQPFSFSSPEAEMDAMAELAEAGKVRSIGVSNFSADQMRRAHAALAKHGLKLAANQVHYSLAHRTIEFDGTLQAARELGVSIVAYTPLEYGLLTGIYHKNPALAEQKMFFRRSMLKSQLEATRPLINAMEEIAAKYGATVGQVALNWLVNFHGDMVLTIPGATKPSHVQQNAGAMTFKLSEEELDRLDQSSKKFRTTVR